MGHGLHALRQVGFLCSERDGGKGEKVVNLACQKYRGTGEMGLYFGSRSEARGLRCRFDML